MRKIILDCDNTIGLEKKDVADGLAFLFLLGKQDVDLKGITSVFGNSTIEQTSEIMNKMLADFSLTEKIPHYRGAAQAGDYDTEAAHFLAEQAAAHKNELTLIATGPLSNLYAAWQIDQEFFHNLKEIIVLGGMVEEISFGEYEVDEVNLSADPTAVERVLQAEVPVALMTRNLCLAARFGEKSWRRINRSNTRPIRAYIKDKISDWYKYSSEVIGLSGFYMWDVVPAAYMLSPEIFSYNKRKITSTTADLKRGLIKTEKAAGMLQDAGIINLPTTILDTKRFKDLVFTAWDDIKIIPAGYKND
jgi:inosine-uridine nucleoside N-ribohydrolase